MAPVKGVVLSRWLYDDVSERPYRDVDILVMRPELGVLREIVRRNGWRVRHYSREMGELEFEVGRVVVEAHAEFGRRDLTAISNRDVLDRAIVDATTFPFPVSRIDDIDHLFLLITNVTKKAFTYANAHQPGDFQRLILLLRDRHQETLYRAAAARLVTAFRNVAEWMAEEHRSAEFAALVRMLRTPRRPILSAAIRLHRRYARRQSSRLRSASGLTGIALAVLTPDDPALRYYGLARLIRRGILRRLGGDPG